MSSTWTVVQFDDETVEAVPTTWIVGDRCHWPVVPKQKLISAIRKQEPLNTCWPLHKIKVFRNATFDDYSTARRKSILAEETSDLASEIENLEGKRKRIRKALISSSEDGSPPSIRTKPNTYMVENEIEEASIESPPKLYSIQKKVQTPSSEPSSYVTTPKSHAFEGHRNRGLQDVCNKTCDVCCRSRDTKLLQDVLNQTNIIRVISSDILKEVRSKAMNINNNEGISIFNKFPDIQLPMKTDEEMAAFESEMSNADNFALAVNDLSKLGGNNNYSFVKRALTSLVNNDIAKLYSFYGRKGKRPFHKLVMCKIILNAADKANMAKSEAETESSIKSWLKRSSEREKSTAKKF